MEERKGHRWTLDRRQAAAVTGVEDVISFDEKEILLQTPYGRMTVKGEGLHVKRLDLEKGEADLEGQISGVLYSSAGAPDSPGGGFLSRLFR